MKTYWRTLKEEPGITVFYTVVTIAFLICIGMVATTDPGTAAVIFCLLGIPMFLAWCELIEMAS